MDYVQSEVRLKEGRDRKELEGVLAGQHSLCSLPPSAVWERGDWTFQAYTLGWTGLPSPHRLPDLDEIHLGSLPVEPLSWTAGKVCLVVLCLNR